MTTPTAPRIRLEPADEFMHANTGEGHFNESMYFNFFDPAQQRGGFVRIGNRPNEGYAETTLCLYEPDRSVCFGFQRAPIPDNERFDAGGMAFEVLEPFRKLRVRYAGKACRLARPLEMRDPREAFRANPWIDVELDLAIDGVGPMYGGERAAGDRSSHEIEFAKGHYEQHHRATGRINVAGAEAAFSGLGLRDHSWGPRSWQAPAWYRWLTANFGDDLGFMASIVAARDGSETRGGFLHRGRELVLVKEVALDTSYAGSDRLHDRLRATLRCADGSTQEIEGRVLSLIPLRNRRDGGTTRIAEGMTEWTWNGRTGYGLSEYLDQMGG
jgi:hypothetical protein